MNINYKVAESFESNPSKNTSNSNDCDRSQFKLLTDSFQDSETESADESIRKSNLSDQFYLSKKNFVKPLILFYLI